MYAFHVYNHAVAEDDFWVGFFEPGCCETNHLQTTVFSGTLIHIDFLPLTLSSCAYSGLWIIC